MKFRRERKKNRFNENRREMKENRTGKEKRENVCVCVCLLGRKTRRKKCKKRKMVRKNKSAEKFLVRKSN